HRTRRSQELNMVNGLPRLLRALLTRGLQVILLLPSLFIFPWQSATADSEQKTSLEIGVRNAHGMAYDNKRGRVVLFGGADALKVCSDTWEWDGKRWISVSLVGPGPRT